MKITQLPHNQMSFLKIWNRPTLPQCGKENAILYGLHSLYRILVTLNIVMIRMILEDSVHHFSLLMVVVVMNNKVLIFVLVFFLSASFFH